MDPLLIHRRATLDDLAESQALTDPSRPGPRWTYGWTDRRTYGQTDEHTDTDGRRRGAHGKSDAI